MKDKGKREGQNDIMKDHALDIDWDWYVDSLENMATGFALKALQARKALRLACAKLADYVDKVPTLENKDNVPKTVGECWELYFLEKAKGK